MRRAGGRLLALSVDTPDQSRPVVERNRLDFPILCDTERQVTRAYGLLHESAGADGQDVPKPAMLLIDRTGRILWRRVAELIQDRPDPGDVVKVIRTSLGS